MRSPRSIICVDACTGPVIIKGRAWKVYAAGVAVVARNDGDIGDGGGVSQGEE